MNEQTWTYRRGLSGVCTSNLMFNSKWPMRGGKFPKDHPCYINPEAMTVWNPPETPDKLGRFRGRGYWASCFPEGDGITFTDKQERPGDEVMKDIRECFGVDVKEAQ
jgi:hypothetical protein